MQNNLSNNFIVKVDSSEMPQLPGVAAGLGGGAFWVERA